MSHPSIRQWSDFVRGLSTRDTAERLRRHLEAGCRRCVGRVKALETVHRVARSDRREAVPAHVTRSAHDIFRIERLLAERERAPRRLALSFDSVLTPALGVRSEPGAARHLVYEARDYMVGLQLEPRTEKTGPCLSGQVLDTADGPIEGVSVFLLESNRLRDRGFSDRHGSFRLRGPGRAPSRVVFLMPAGEMVDVEVPARADRDGAPA